MTAPQVVVAAVIECEGRYLLARRRTGSQAGRWEFPGGKVRTGEDPRDALVRELQEELGIRARVGDLLLEVPFASGTRPYLLAAYRTEHMSGTCCLRDHTELRWVRGPEILEMDLTPADVDIAKLLARSS